MTTPTETQPKLIAAKVTPQDHRRIHSAAALRGQKTADAIREGLELWLQATICPQCDAPTIPHPDPTMTGVRYCPNCRESVAYPPQQEPRDE